MRRRAWAIALLAFGCGDPSAPGQTVHDRSIVVDETWSRAASPHVVRGSLIIAQGATLTIEAGATVLFAANAGLSAGFSDIEGTLLALGTAESPVEMRGLEEGSGAGSWTGLAFRSSTRSTLRHVTLGGCGAQSPLFNGRMPPACLALGNPLLESEDPTLLVDHVTVEDGQGSGVALFGQARFAPGSTALSVRRMRGHVARLPARAAGRFPLGGTFVDNDSNEVRLEEDTVVDSMTLATGIPWTVVGTLRIGGPSEPVVTIPAGAAISLRGSIIVGETAPGGLQVGSDAGPTATLQPGAARWGHVDFRARAVRSHIINAVLDSCGGEGTPCVSIIGSFTGPPAPAPVLRNVSIRNAVGFGAGIFSGGRFGPSSANLSITGAGISPLAVGASPVHSIPSGQYTGNASDRIWIFAYDVRQDDTLAMHGVPYYVSEHVSVGDAVTRPSLVVKPGVTVIAAPGAQIRTGVTAPGAIVAVGTGTEQITFTGNASEPGSWTGIVVGRFADPSTAFNHVVVDYAGAPAQVGGSFHFYVDIGPVIRNSVIRRSASCGVIIVNQPPWSTDFTSPTLGNNFVHNAGGSICGP